MRTFDQTVVAIGRPMSCVVLDDWSGRELVVARWRHRDVHIKRTDEDALRIVMNLGLQQAIRYRQAGFATSVASVPGDIFIYPPVEAFETIVEGESDVLQIFIDADALALQGPVARPLLNVASEDLRACALALFMTAHSGARSPAATMLCGTVRQLLAARTQPGDGSFHGGLRPASLRRIEKLIDELIDGARAGPQPAVGDLAAVARLSVSQFIRAFRQTTGATPYQYVMARRRQRALGLLREPQTSVAEVADTLGFSSPAHFIASFRRRFGTTPGDYRQAVMDPDLLTRSTPLA